MLLVSFAAVPGACISIRASYGLDHMLDPPPAAPQFRDGSGEILAGGGELERDLLFRAPGVEGLSFRPDHFLFWYSSQAIRIEVGASGPVPNVSFSLFLNSNKLIVCDSTYTILTNMKLINNNATGAGGAVSQFYNLFYFEFVINEIDEMLYLYLLEFRIYLQLNH